MQNNTKNFICDSDRYTISPTNTIALPVALENLPNEIKIEEEILVLKSSFHISLVCINQIVLKYKVDILNFRDLVLKDFCEFTKTNDISLVKYTNEFKFAVENDLKTIIVLCDVSNLNNFFHLINKKYGLNIEYPPTHVTLYALPNKLGIFLTDSNDIETLTKPILNPIGRNL